MPPLTTGRADAGQPFLRQASGDESALSKRGSKLLESITKRLLGTSQAVLSRVPAPVKKGAYLIDLWAGCLFELYWVVTSPALSPWLLCKGLYHLIFTGGPSSAYDVDVIASQITWIQLCSLRFILWMTFSFNHEHIHKMWKFKAIHVPKLMPGGFVPRPAALALGILLFITSTLVTESKIPGGRLAKPFDTDKGGKFQFCRADHMAIPTDTGLLARFHRTSPSGCYKTDPRTVKNAWVTQPSFSWEELHSLGEQPPNLIYPETGGGRLDYSANCVYECIIWKEVKVSEIFAKLGIVVSGAVVAVAIADWLSTACGWGLVTQDTGPKTLKRLLGRISSEGFPGSRWLCACQVHIIVLATRTLAYGMGAGCIHSGDMKVNYVVVTAVLFTVLQRWWSPFTLRSMIYTWKLWTQGEDEFVALPEELDSVVGRESPNHIYTVSTISIDLYTWIHLSREDRSAYLINYARRLDTNTQPGTPVLCLHSFQVEKNKYDQLELWHPGRGAHEKYHMLIKDIFSIEKGSRGKVERKTGDMVVVKWESGQESEVHEKYLVEDSEEWRTFEDEIQEDLPQHVNLHRCLLSRLGNASGP